MEFILKSKNKKNNMTLKEFLKNIEKAVNENPELLNMKVVSAIDDEGNGFNEVHFTPTPGIFEDGEWTPAEHLKEEGRDEKELNAICIN